MCELAMVLIPVRKHLEEYQERHNFPLRLESTRGMLGQIAVASAILMQRVLLLHKLCAQQ